MLGEWAKTEILNVRQSTWAALRLEKEKSDSEAQVPGLATGLVERLGNAS